MNSNCTKGMISTSKTKINNCTTCTKRKQCFPLTYNSMDFRTTALGHKSALPSYYLQQIFRVIFFPYFLHTILIFYYRVYG